MSNECPLEDLGGFDLFTDKIQYCPFCGSDADTDFDAGVGYARCSACGEGFWVEL